MREKESRRRERICQRIYVELISKSLGRIGLHEVYIGRTQVPHNFKNPDYEKLLITDIQALLRCAAFLYIYSTLIHLPFTHTKKKKTKKGCGSQQVPSRHYEPS